MSVFSVISVFYDKTSLPAKTSVRGKNVMQLRLYENYSKFLYWKIKHLGTIDKGDYAELKARLPKEAGALYWLKYAILAKASGIEQEALDGFVRFKELAEKTGEIERQTIPLLSKIFSQRLDAIELPSALSAVDRLDLGWFRHLAHELIYSASDMEEKAEEAAGAAVNEAAAMFWKFLLLGLMFLTIFISGIAVLIVGFRRHKILKMFDRSGAYEFKSSYLFKTFILWLFFYSLLKIVLRNSDFFMLRFQSLDAPMRLLLVIVITLLPCTAFLYLIRKIKLFSLPIEEIYLKAESLRRLICYGIGGYIASVPLLFMSVFAMMPLFKKLEKTYPTPPHPLLEITAGAKSPLELALIFILASIVAPVVEEFIFRGVLQNAIKIRFGPWPGIIISSVIFSLLHQQLPLGFLPIMILGLVFGVLAETKKSLVPSIVAHSINNSVAFAVVRIIA